MHETFERLGMIGLVPVVKLDDARKAPDLGRALAAGGIPAAEITFRSGAAADAIAALRAGMPELLVGAGTVLNREQAARAIDAGAQFLVSPGFDEAVVGFAIECGIPVPPGVSGPDGVLRGIAMGLDTLKFFPAEASGGIPMLDALAGPFSNIRFVPTGGIDAGNLGAWVRRPNVLAVGGSWMVPSALIQASDWKGIEALCRQALRALHGFAVARVAIGACAGGAGAGCTGAGGAGTSAQDAARLLMDVFGIEGRPRADGVSFQGLDVMAAGTPWTRGIIAVRCNGVERALARLAAAGMRAVPGTEQSERGLLKEVRLDRELLGFSLVLARD